MTTVWLVRAGEHSRHADEFVASNVIAVGWPNIPGLVDLRGRSRDEILSLLISSHLSSTPEADANELVAFRDDIAVNDLVITPDASARDLLIGFVTGGYEYLDPSPAGDYRHVRSTRWVGRWDRDLVPEILLLELRYRRTLRRLSIQREWISIAQRIDAGEGRPSSRPKKAMPVRRRSASRQPASVDRRMCSDCTQLLALSQYAPGSTRCRTCEG